MNNIKQMLVAAGWQPSQVNGQTVAPKLLAHWMNWFGDSHYHPMNRYTSSNNLTIGRQLDVMQAVGVDGVIVTWQGTNNALGQTATLAMATQLAERGMILVLLADPWLMNNQQHGEQQVIAQLTSQAGLSMLQSPAYIPEGYFLDFTNNLFDHQTVINAVQPYLPSFNILSRHTGYSWPEIENTLNALRTDNQNSTMKIPGLYYKFMDGGLPSVICPGDNPVPASRGDGQGNDYNTQTWGRSGTDTILTLPSRVIEDQAGNNFFDALGVTPLTSKYIALVTWNDYNERTAWEPFCSILAGERIS